MKEIAGVKLYTVAEVMEALSCSKDTVRRRYRSGELKVRRLGGRVYFLEADLHEYLTGEKIGQRVGESPIEHGLKRKGTARLEARRKEIEKAIRETLTYRQAADRLGCTEKTFRSWRERLGL